jgi:ABC-type multidrug transport system ATPase subunit
MNKIIEVKNLSKDFNEIRAVDDLSFTVEEGQVYGFLGQNGAGKSTTIRMLLTLIRPTAGSISIFGLDLYKHRNEILRQVGAIIEKPDLYKYLTALENLKLFSAMSGVRLTEKKLMEQLEMVGLAERAKSKVKTYSQGMKQRLGIATALVHDPRLIILDEPTNGLDPQGIADIRNLILELSHEKNKTLVVSSHLLGEMELIADAMLIINKGKKIVEGKKAVLLDPADTDVELETDSEEETIRVIRSSEWSDRIGTYNNGKILLRIRKSEVPALNRMLVSNNINVISLRQRHSLEDYFLSLTAH